MKHREVPNRPIRDPVAARSNDLDQTVQLYVEYCYMPSMTLKAHFNGDRVILDEPAELKPDTKLLVTILPDSEGERSSEWFRLAEGSFDTAFGDNEPEYGVEDLVEVNPEYERG